MNIQTSEQCDQLFTALAAAQGELGPAIKNANNPAFSSKYADLGANLEEAYKVFPKHGISVTQIPVRIDDRIGMVTILGHKSGQWIKADGPSMAPMKAGPHAVGSVITYLRRYMLGSMLGLWAEDDDANTAQGVKTSAEPLPAEPAKRVKPKAEPKAKEKPSTDILELDRIKEQLETAAGDGEDIFKEVFAALKPDVRKELAENVGWLAQMKLKAREADKQHQ